MNLGYPIAYCDPMNYCFTSSPIYQCWVSNWPNEHRFRNHFSTLTLGIHLTTVTQWTIVSQTIQVSTTTNLGYPFDPIQLHTVTQWNTVSQSIQYTNLGCPLDYCDPITQWTTVSHQLQHTNLGYPAGEPGGALGWGLLRRGLQDLRRRRRGRGQSGKAGNEGDLNCWMVCFSHLVVHSGFSAIGEKMKITKTSRLFF